MGEIAECRDRKRGYRDAPRGPGGYEHGLDQPAPHGLGVGIYRHTTVGDNPERLVAALREAASDPTSWSPQAASALHRTT